MINRRLLQAMLATALLAGSVNIVSAAAAPKKIRPMTTLCLLALLSNATASDACSNPFLDGQISRLEDNLREVTRFMWLNTDDDGPGLGRYFAASNFKKKTLKDLDSLIKERDRHKTHCESWDALEKAFVESKRALHEENQRRTCANNATTNRQIKQSHKRR